MLKGPLVQSVTYKRGSVTVNLMWRVSTATAVSRATTTCPPPAAPTVAALGSRPRPSALTSDSVPVFLGSVAPPATDAYLDTTTYPPPDALPATVPSSEFIAPRTSVMSPQASAPVLETLWVETVPSAPRDSMRQTAPTLMPVSSVCVPTGAEFVRMARPTLRLLPGHLTSRSSAVRTL